MPDESETRYLFGRYKRGEIDSTEVQNLLNEKVEVPDQSIVELFVELMEARRIQREGDPKGVAALRRLKKEYLFFIAILGNTPQQMGYKQFVEFCIEHGAESREAFESGDEKWRNAFWARVTEIDMELSVFGDE